jgi:hypothetical protein
MPQRSVYQIELRAVINACEDGCLVVHGEFYLL